MVREWVSRDTHDWTDLEAPTSIVDDVRPIRFVLESITARNC